MGQSEAHKKNNELLEAQNLIIDSKFFQNNKIFLLKLYISCPGNIFSTEDVILSSAHNFIANIATHWGGILPKVKNITDVYNFHLCQSF